MSTVPSYSSDENAKPLDAGKILNEFRDQPELISRLLQLFIAETQKDYDGLADAFAASDPSRIVRIAHRLKGAAATVGAEPLRAEAARIEGLARQGDLQQARDRMTTLHSEFDRLHEYLAEF